MTYCQHEIRGLESSPIRLSRVLFDPLFGRAHFWAVFGCHRTVISPLSQCLVGVIGDAAWPRPWQKSNVGAVFPIASRELRATFFFPSGSKFLPFGFEVITNGLTGNSSKMGADELCPTARGSDVSIVDNTQRENLLMSVVKQVKHAGSF